MAQKYHVFNLATGTHVHTLIDEKDVKRYIKHYEKYDQQHEGGPLAVVAWEPGSIKVLARDSL
jgi:hypothetical protein